MLINGTTAGTPIDFFDTPIRTRNDPYRRLGAMVLIQAIKDACSPYTLFEGGYTREGATHFLLHDNIDFPQWCVGLGLDPRTVRLKLYSVIHKYQTKRLLKEYEYEQRRAKR